MRGAIWFCLMMATSAAAQEQLLCGDIDEGARDYRLMSKKQRLHIEGAHFTRDVEMLKRGKSSYLGNDIDYTLRHIPNHPHALNSLARLAQRTKVEKVSGTQYPVWCYFERAVRFAPDDALMRYVFGLYLLRAKKPTEARAQLALASELAGESAGMNYNLGLVYLELGDLDAAQRHAKVAYAKGSSPPALANRLRAAGKWPD